MIKDALEWIKGQCAPSFYGKASDGGIVYVDKKLEMLPQPKPAALAIGTLTGLVDYMNDNVDQLDKAAPFLQPALKDYI